MQPLLRLVNVGREFETGGSVVTAIAELTLSIEAGEMVAIIGPSGSGKTTLMNILGCLDLPSLGTYEVDGRSVVSLSSDSLAELRREYFGFVFQRYQLLGSLTAVSNVEMPAVYAGVPPVLRHQRAAHLMEQFGVHDRLHHLPSELSGGQQQRVSIARALMNGARVILADEPTGALDRASGQEVMSILNRLHRRGHTVVVVTHDPGIAAHAERIIELCDGRVVRDERVGRSPNKGQVGVVATGRLISRRAYLDLFLEASSIALVALSANRLRSVLTMLGITIGIASVVSVVALGAASRQRILSDIRGLGTNTIEVMPGTGLGDRRAAAVQTLRAADADALAKLGYVDSASPSVSANVDVRHDNIDVAASVTGVGADFFRVHGYDFALGKAFDLLAVTEQAQQAVVDEKTAKTLFSEGENPVGQTILLGSVPVRIVGVTRKKASAFGSDESLNVWIPYPAATARLMGADKLRSISVRVSESASMSAAEAGTRRLLVSRHGTTDFFLLNTDAIRQTVERTTQTIALLISSIAFVSLLVGGIGVMNMMLVTVVERTPEIGIRMAVGARRSDILRQFLVEAVLVCCIGGAIGILLAVCAGLLINHFATDFRVPFPALTIVSAMGVSTAVGVAFGLLPARNAAALAPIAALGHE